MMQLPFTRPKNVQRSDSAFPPGHLRDQTRAPLPGEIGPEPLALHTQSVLQLWQRHEMQDDPNEPSDKPTHAKMPALQYREILADDRHVAFVEISERMFWLSSFDLS